MTHLPGFEAPKRAKTDVWLTPKPILDALGPFDLDPCAAPEPRPWPTARAHYSAAEGDGLRRPWAGSVWLNPPYSRAGDWLAKLAEHGLGIALLFVRTDSAWMQDHGLARASGFLLLRKRIHFCYPDGTPTKQGFAPSVFFAYGDDALRRLARAPLEGHLVVAAATCLLTAEGQPVGTWREAVEAALAGRTLRLHDLYRAAEGTAKVRQAKEHGHNWRAQIRRALQAYCRPVDHGVWSPA